MSTDTTTDRLRYLDSPSRVRFRPRDEAPEPLFGPPNVNYPGRDGRPMADNTLQFQWINKITGGLDDVFQDDPDVFVAGNLMWYPVEDRNRRRLAPDAMVIFGRPKGYRDSYVQHKENHIPPHVVFEVFSPGNRKRVMDYKRTIYEMYGVQEYYHFDPYKITLEIWLKEGDAFRLEPEASGWVSPLLGIRFELGEDMTIFGPDNRPFQHQYQTIRQRNEAERQRDEANRNAERERAIAEEANRNAGRERAIAEEANRNAGRERAIAEEANRNAERERATAEEANRNAGRERAIAEEANRNAERERAAAEEARAVAEDQRQRADLMAERLRSLGLKP